ncbi:type VI secretion system Vgr family protein [Cupriavidus agavae]|uniref:Type VI secretion system secreted protein VgrG n=1 Tax=Cupriavidus agavae TaxID=1001822 RepID=A0A4Q7S8K0_9BURK|nr:type VI secretion system Vgr family protein [Cupriavidus agavae]RZT42088.1 type VI secretion system secreted protein VgrG [Cupriavidus agavae]
MRDCKGSYFLQVPSAREAVALSVVGFEAVERLGELYRVVIELTHPARLDRTDFLNRPAVFVLDPESEGEEGNGTGPRRFGGWISAFSHISRCRDLHGYRITIEPEAARLRLTSRSRVYQHKTAPQIIEAILRAHGLLGHQFAFRLCREYPEHRFRLQYRQSDWDYVRLLMEQEGLYCYFEWGEFGERMVFGDDIDHYLYKPALDVPCRPTAGLESGAEAVFRVETHARTVPASVRTADYNPGAAWERVEGTANVARKDRTTYGEPYVFGTHHSDQAGARWEAQLRHEAALAGQVVHEGESNVLALRPGRVFRMDTMLPDSPDGQVVTEVTHSGARDRAYRNRFRAIPCDRRFRLPVDETRWPRIGGTLSGRVTSPGQYKYAYLTQDGHYVVRFDLDFDDWPGGAESVPLRLAKPFAGARQTGFHFPLIDGAEVAIAFHDGNPNRPYIAHALHNSQHEDLITSRDRWLSRNVIRTQSNNKLRFEDWEGQHGVKLASGHGSKSQLNLGYLVDRARKCRGEGFELRTSAWGVLRAGKGLFVAADDQPRAGGSQLDMERALAQLRQAQQMVESLGEAARAAGAIAADHKRQRALLEETLEELKRAGLLASAPAGMALASGTDLQLSAAENLIGTAGGHADVSVLKRLTVAAGQRISLFVQKLGMKLVAASGKVEIEAQSDEMRLLADRNLTISSAAARTVIDAKEEIILKCGGSYLRISATGIEDGTRGERTMRSAGIYRGGPTSLAQEMNQWKHASFDEDFVLRNAFDETPIANRKFKILRSDGSVIHGMTDAEGRTGLQKSLFVEGVQLEIDPE